MTARRRIAAMPAPTPVPLPAFAGYGIELEYMIVDHDSLSVQPLADRLLCRAAGRPSAEVIRGAFGWSNELTRHLVEIKNLAPSPGLDSLPDGFQAQVAEIDAMLAEFNARLMPTAMHPWMDPARDTRLWNGPKAALYRSYQRIFGCRSHGWANLQSMQINLPFADDAEFARLHAAVRLILPLLPALAASSPCADGRLQTDLDHRMVCYLAHAEQVPALTGRLVPDPVTSRAQYEREVQAPMYDAIAPLDPDGALRHEWLDSRGAIPRFDRQAIEIRIIDSQECPAADIALAALTAAAVRAVYEQRWSDLAAQQAMDTEALRTLLLACMKNGEATLIEDARYLALLGVPAPRLAAGAVWRHLFDACAKDPLLTPPQRDVIAALLARGTLASAIRQAIGPDCEQKRLEAVYRTLCGCLAEGRLFVT